MLSGESVSEMTFMPEPCAEAMSISASGWPPSASSRQLSDTLRTASMASDVLTWPVTVSASMSRTERPRRVCRAAARFVAMVVLPTPPFGLKTAMTVARRDVQPSMPMSAALDDRAAAAVVDGLAADAHGLDPPADRTRP